MVSDKAISGSFDLYFPVYRNNPVKDANQGQC